MAGKIVIFFAVIVQALGHHQRSISAGHLAASRVSSSSSSQSISTSSSSSGGGWSGGNVGSSLQEILSAQANLRANLQKQTASLNQAQQTYEKQLATWYFQSPELQRTFSEAIATISGLLKQATTYIDGAERMLDVIRQPKSGNQLEWSQRIRKLQSLAELSLTRVSNSIATILRNVFEISEDQKVYAEAKSKQLTETKSQMDIALEQLLKQTIKIGEQTSATLAQAIKEWSQMLRTHLGSGKAEAAIARLREICEQILAELGILRPEDIETALSDAHRVIEDLKTMFYSYGVPPMIVSQSVKQVQLTIFRNLTHARSLHN